VLCGRSAYGCAFSSRCPSQGVDLLVLQLRAVWYVIEVLAQENSDVGSGVVMIIWDKNFTIWDYDDRLYERMTHFDMNGWPVKVTACHCSVAPWFVFKIVKPLLG
jgi:hypothetical protein